MEPQGDSDLAPTFEDLAIDDSLGDLERIQKYAYSNIALQRCVTILLPGGFGNLSSFLLSGTGLFMLKCSQRLHVL